MDGDVKKSSYFQNEKNKLTTGKYRLKNFFLILIQRAIYISIRAETAAFIGLCPRARRFLGAFWGCRIAELRCRALSAGRFFTENSGILGLWGVKRGGWVL
jgi:hypothetical protein